MLIVPEQAPTGQYPAVMHSPWWVLLALALVGIGLTLTILAGRRSTRPTPRPVEDPVDLETLRRHTLARLDEVGVDLASGRVSSSTAHRRIGAVCRRFLGVATASDIDFESMDDLRRRADDDARLSTFVPLLASCVEAGFDPGHADDPAIPRLDAARTAVSSWH